MLATGFCQLSESPWPTQRRDPAYCFRSLISRRIAKAASSTPATPNAKRIRTTSGEPPPDPVGVCGNESSPPDGGTSVAGFNAVIAEGDGSAAPEP